MRDVAFRCKHCDFILCVECAAPREAPSGEKLKYAMRGTTVCQRCGVVHGPIPFTEWLDLKKPAAPEPAP
jgi:hypothetical protein